MRLEQVKHDVSHVGMMETAKATIKATPKIFSFFENSTYANKPLAIARELVANGVDSHTEAGCPHRAIEVTLPCELDPVFKVRDFGVGMTHEFLMGPYMEYTNGSTKDGSNDQIGGFGIGSKSPFAYTSQYTVRSVRDGVVEIAMEGSCDHCPAAEITMHARFEHLLRRRCPWLVEVRRVDE